MRTRTAAQLCWGLWALAAALVVASLILSGSAVGFRVVVFAIATVGFSTVGALVASRYRLNPIGWLFCAAGLISAVDGFANAYALRALVLDPGSLRDGMAAAWIQNWIWIALIGLIATFVLLLFPDGRLLSGRWRPVGWAAAMALGTASLGFAFNPGSLGNGDKQLAAFTNPTGLGPAAGAIGLLGLGLLLVTAIAAVVSLVLRFRRSGGQERQQIKWFAYGGILLGVVVVIGSALWEVSPIARFLVPLSLALAPVTAGIAILKYRLYDIDRIINRTLVYAVLTAGLLGVYGGSVLLLQYLFSPLTRQSDLAVALSTLAVAALFNPARRRIQSAVDRRFYRQKYDAVRILAAFGSTARDEVELDQLTRVLATVITETMQPEHVSVWLREGQGR